MGGCFTCYFVPVFTMTPERREEAVKLVEQELTKPELSKQETSIEEYEIEQTVAAIDDYAEMAARADSAHSDCCEISLHPDYPVYISGGVTWGDDPTDSYTIMRWINQCDALYDQMVIWARADRAARDAEMAKRRKAVAAHE